MKFLVIYDTTPHQLIFCKENYLSTKKRERKMLHSRFTQYTYIHFSFIKSPLIEDLPLNLCLTSFDDRKLSPQIPFY